MPKGSENLSNEFSVSNAVYNSATIYLPLLTFTCVTKQT